MKNNKPSGFTVIASLVAVLAVMTFFISGVFGSENDYQDDVSDTYAYNTGDYAEDDDFGDSTTYDDEVYTSTRYNTVTFSSAVADDVEKDHVFLRSKNKGDCRTLTGDVVITMVFVDDSDSTWTEEAISKFKENEEFATKKLEREAEMNGVELNLTVRYTTATAYSKLAMSGYDEWVSEAVYSMGYYEKSQVTSDIKKQYSAKEAPVMFAVNRSGRSFANTESNYEDGFEYAILYAPDSGNYRHELYHLFGAQDYYYPEKVEKIAKEYFPTSSMSYTEKEDFVDSFSAYLIGWDEQMDSDAKAFFDEISWVTDDILNEARAAATYTGWNTVRSINGTYTGDLVDGMNHGQGTMVWDNGEVYEGGWSNGQFNGYGKLKSKNGTYTGDFVDGMNHGQGTMVWDSGEIYEGEWSNGQINGYGKYTFPDGGSLEGDWVDGAIDGYAVQILPDGGVYKGNMLGQYYEGYGVMVYSDGAVYDGYWTESKYNGYGTFTYSDGSVKEGYWEMGEFLG